MIDLLQLLGLILAINLAAATQDIATDGLSVRLPERWRGLCEQPGMFIET